MQANILKKNAILPATAEVFSVSKKYVVYSSVMSIIFLALSLVANFAANVFATNRMGNPVNDLILDNIPTYNVSALFFQGFGLFLAFVIILLIIKPKRVPFALKGLLPKRNFDKKLAKVN